MRSDVMMQSLGQVESCIRSKSRGISHMKPRPNTIVSANFLRAAICRRQIMGIGKMMMTTSMLRFMIQVARKMFVLDPQTPGRRGVPILGKGSAPQESQEDVPDPKRHGKSHYYICGAAKGFV